MSRTITVVGVGGSGGAEGTAPSLVQRGALGKNNSPFTGPTGKGKRRVKGYRPCPKLPGRRIRLQSDANPSLTCLLKCKGWGCSGCGPWMKDRFIKVASQEARRVFATGRFLTLTLPPEARGLETKDQFKLMSQVWAKWVKRVERQPTHHVKCKKGRLCPACASEIEPCGARTVRLAARATTCRKGHLCESCGASGKPCGKVAVPKFRKFTAIWVREAHDDGTPHLHCLVDRFIKQAWVSKSWQECGGGKVVDIRRAPIQRVVAYVTKYLAKSLAKKHPSFGVGDGLRGIRRYGTTGEAKLVGIYPVKKGTDPWRIWYKPGLLMPMDWTPVMRGEEKYAIAWVTMHFGEGKLDPTIAGRMANAIRDRQARLRAQQASQVSLANPVPEDCHIAEDRLEQIRSFWANRRSEGY